MTRPSRSNAKFPHAWTHLLGNLAAVPPPLRVVQFAVKRIAKMQPLERVPVFGRVLFASLITQDFFDKFEVKFERNTC